MSLIFFNGFDFFNTAAMARIWLPMPDFLASLSRTDLSVEYARTNAYIWHSDVRVASVSDITLSAPGATIDGVTMVAGNRVLAKDQSDATENGIYVWLGAATAMIRASDANADAELPRTAVYVTDGSVNTDTSWTLNTPAPVTLGTTDLIFAQFFGAPYSTGQGLRCFANNGPGGVAQAFPDNYTTMVLGFAVNVSTIGAYSDANFAALGEFVGPVDHIAIGLNTSGRIIIRRGSTVLATGTTIILPNVYYYVEVKVTVDDAAGEVELRLNGLTEITLSGADTRNGGSGVLNYFKLWLGNANGSYWVTFDDVYCLWPDPGSIFNNDFLGDQKVVSVRPSGAGFHQDWAPSAGSNYENIDDPTPDDDATYNSSATAGDKDTFVHRAQGNLSQINGVAHHVYMRKDDAGSRAIAPLTRVFSTDYPAATFPVLDTYTYASDLQDVNPATGLPWTLEELNEAEFGYEEIS